MKALAYDPATDRFSVAEQPVPSPGPHDVLVRVRACGLNPVVNVPSAKPQVGDADGF